MNWEEKEDTTVYKVVMNHEEQYSIWPVYREIPPGWKEVGKSGLKAECLEYIKETWTDMRPLSLRKKMEEMAKKKKDFPPPPRKKSASANGGMNELVKRLSTGKHPVIASLRPERTTKILKECIDRGYVHIKFTETKGGTELGVRLDQEICDLSKADFEKESGILHLAGNLILNYVKVQCVADIDIKTLEGKGYLVPIVEDKSKA